MTTLSWLFGVPAWLGAAGLLIFKPRRPVAGNN